ncbi:MULTISPECIES: hypothetical protein [Rhizobium]|uniref:Uncharacterized protein n=1 Tax=Rhizobium esperanzae TaxID=1967781 RepID=A0A7W6XYD9_9HYPH|nr:MULTISPECIES: hypothetical protein [Rhizobium]MBB4440885.1 hypothetical protein [Rhizobium esperanzae]MDH6203316.1 hypothetical protein [Rhizobium leguminosarum]
MTGNEKASRQLGRLEGYEAGRSASLSASFPPVLLKYTVNHVIHGGRKPVFCFHL